MFPAIGLDPARAGVPVGAEPSAVVPVGLEPAATGRPLAAFVDATQGAVQEVLDVTDPMMCFTAIARLSGHLAAMCRTVYPYPKGRLDADGQLRDACLRRARATAWALRLLECQLSGEAATVGLPVTAVSATLAEHLGSYRSAEQALVTWLEDQLPAEGRDKLALKYGRALTRAPTRPHPRCPRTGPLACAAFWLYGRWDRLLDVMDSRPGVGRDFLVLTGRRDDVPGTGGQPG